MQTSHAALKATEHPAACGVNIQIVLMLQQYMQWLDCIPFHWDLLCSADTPLLRTAVLGYRWPAGSLTWSRCLSSFSGSTSSSSTAHANSSSRQTGGSKPSKWGLLGVAAAAAGALLTNSVIADSKLKDFKAATAAGPSKAVQEEQHRGKGGSLPEYTADEVYKHRTPKDRVWVTYKDGVYDITDFIAQVCSTVVWR